MDIVPVYGRCDDRWAEYAWREHLAGRAFLHLTEWRAAWDAGVLR